LPDGRDVLGQPRTIGPGRATTLAAARE
jgi:hypothetical protein